VITEALGNSNQSLTSTPVEFEIPNNEGNVFLMHAEGVEGPDSFEVHTLETLDANGRNWVSVDEFTVKRLNLLRSAEEIEQLAGQELARQKQSGEYEQYQFKY